MGAPGGDAGAAGWRPSIQAWHKAGLEFRPVDPAIIEVRAVLQKQERERSKKQRDPAAPRTP